MYITCKLGIKIKDYDDIFHITTTEFILAIPTMPIWFLYRISKFYKLVPIIRDIIIDSLKFVLRNEKLKEFVFTRVFGSSSNGQNINLYSDSINHTVTQMLNKTRINGNIDNILLTNEINSDIIDSITASFSDILSNIKDSD